MVLTLWKSDRHVALYYYVSILFRAILSQFTVEQMERYEFFRRSRFKKADMRKVCLFYNFSVHFPSIFPCALSLVVGSFKGCEFELLTTWKTFFLLTQNLLVLHFCDPGLGMLRTKPPKMKHVHLTECCPWTCSCVMEKRKRRTT